MRIVDVKVGETYAYDSYRRGWSPEPAVVIEVPVKYEESGHRRRTLTGAKVEISREVVDRDDKTGEVIESTRRTEKTVAHVEARCLHGTWTSWLLTKRVQKKHDDEQAAYKKRENESANALIVALKELGLAQYFWTGEHVYDVKIDNSRDMDMLRQFIEANISTARRIEVARAHLARAEEHLTHIETLYEPGTQERLDAVTARDGLKDKIRRLGGVA